MSVVVKVGGKALHDGAVAIALAEASAAVDHLVIVHGGGSDVDDLLQRLGQQSKRIEGRRVTPSSEIDIVAGVLAGSANKRLVASLRAQGCRAVGLSLVDLDADVRWIDRESLGHVGEVGGMDPAFIVALLDAGATPVVASIGSDLSGELLNVNADECASSIAASLGATLVLLTDVPGVLDEEGEVIPTIDATSAEALIASGRISGGMIPKTRSALALGSDVIIASYAQISQLDAMLDGAPIGTRIRRRHASV